MVASNMVCNAGLALLVWILRLVQAARAPALPKHEPGTEMTAVPRPETDA